MRLEDYLFYLLIAITLLYFFRYGRTLFLISRFAQQKGIDPRDVKKALNDHVELREELRDVVVKMKSYKIMFYVFLVATIVLKLVFYVISD